MRLLYVSNYFPPHYVGGYELHAGQVARWMADRGHRVRVLTGDFRRDDAPDAREIQGLDVRRELQLRYWTDVTDIGLWRREWSDVRLFRRHLRDFQPHVTVLWNMVKLSPGIVMEAQRRAPGLIYHLMDEWAANFREANGWPQFWARPARSPWGRILKPLARALCAPALLPGGDISQWRPQRAVLVSRALGRLMDKHHVRFDETHVSYITYDPAPFEAARARRARAAAPESGPVRFLWAGRLCEGKGLYTTLEALDILSREGPTGWALDFCGPMEEDDRARFLEERLPKAPWADRVRYLGSLPHADMPAQYYDHDIFLFTSQVHEGLPGTIVEAFAAGLPVIGTVTGGTGDILRPDENCLVYPMGDSAALARAMARMIAEPALRQRLSQGVEEFARSQCSTETVFPRLEAYYRQAAGPID